jgi:hypothetical protein
LFFPRFSVEALLSVSPLTDIRFDSLCLLVDPLRDTWGFKVVASDGGFCRRSRVAFWGDEAGLLDDGEDGGDDLLSLGEGLNLPSELSPEGPSWDCVDVFNFGRVDSIDPFLDEDSMAFTSCAKDGETMIGGRISRCTWWIVCFAGLFGAGDGVDCLDFVTACFLDDDRECSTRPEISMLKLLAKVPPRSLLADDTEDFLELEDSDRGLRFPTPSFAPLVLCERLCATLGRRLRSGEVIFAVELSAVVLAEVAWLLAPVSRVATTPAATVAAEMAAAGCDLGREWWEPALRTVLTDDDDKELDDKCWRTPPAIAAAAAAAEEEASGRAGVVGGAVDELAIANNFPEIGLGCFCAALGYGQGVKNVENSTASSDRPDRRH